MIIKKNSKLKNPDTKKYKGIIYHKDTCRLTSYRKRSYEMGCMLSGTVICKGNNSKNITLNIDKFSYTFIILLKNIIAYLYLPLY